MAYPIKYMEDNLVFNHDGEVFAYYELIQAISMEGMDIERVYPIGIVTLASCIEKAGRYSLEIFDMNMAADPYGELREKMFSYQPDIIGISLRNVDPLGNRTTSLIDQWL